jgi:hypothetical protein
MHANTFTLETAREHETELLKLAAPKVLPPERLAPRRRPRSLRRRLRARAVRPAVDGTRTRFADS